MNELVDPKFMGRVTAWIDPFMMFAHSLALGIIAAVFPNWISVDALYYAIGILMVGISFYYLAVLPRMVRAEQRAGLQNEMPV